MIMSNTLFEEEILQPNIFENVRVRNSYTRVMAIGASYSTNRFYILADNIMIGVADAFFYWYEVL